MNCLEFRRVVLADPRWLGAERENLTFQSL